MNSEEYMLFVSIQFFLEISQDQTNLTHGSTAGTPLTPFWNEAQLSLCLGYTPHFGHYKFGVIPTKIPDQAGKPDIAD